MVGFTTDHRGLILSVRRGAKSGRYVVNVDDALLDAVDEVRAERAEEANAATEAGTRQRPESARSVREMQVRLRRGLTIDHVAREARVEAAGPALVAVPVRRG